MKLALDENLPPSLAYALHALLEPSKDQVISIPKRFGYGIADIEWISALHAEGGWAVLTEDRKLRTRPHERRALEQSNLVVFILAAGWNQEAYLPKAAGVVRWLPRLIGALADYHPPMLLEIPHRWSPMSIRPWRR